MNREKLAADLIQGLLLAMVVILAIPMPNLAWAQDLSTSVTQVGSGIREIPGLVSGVFYIGGAVLIGAGALKLKAHSENPVQTPILHGLGRLGAGAALVALPSFADWLNQTLSIGYGTPTVNGFSSIPF